MSLDNKLCFPLLCSDNVNLQANVAYETAVSNGGQEEPEYAEVLPVNPPKRNELPEEPCYEEPT